MPEQGPTNTNTTPSTPETPTPVQAAIRAGTDAYAEASQRMAPYQAVEVAEAAYARAHDQATKTK